MKEYKLFAQRIGLVGIVNIIVNLKGLILIPILTKTLGAEAYGIWSLIIVTISLLSPLALLGLTSAMIRFLAAEKDRTKIKKDFYSIISVVFFAGLFITCSLFLLSDTIALTILNDTSSSNLIKIAAFAILFQSLDLVSLEFFRAFGRMKKYSALLLLQTIAEVGLITYMISSGLGLYGAVISLLISKAMVLIVAVFLISTEIGITKPNFHGLNSYLKFGLPLVPTTILGWIMTSSDRYLIGYFSSSQMLGIYSAAYGISTVIAFFVAPFQIMLFPTISKLYKKGEYKETNKYLEYSLKYFLFFTIPAIFGISVLSKQVLLIMTKTEFVSQGAIIIPIASAGLFFFSLYGSIFTWILYLVERTKLISIISLISAAINIILNIYFIPIYGIVAAAMTTLFSYLILFILTFYFSRKHIKFEIHYPFMSKCILSSCIMTLLLYWFNPIGLYQVGIAILGGAIVYFSSLILMKAFKKEEMTFIKSLL